MNTPEIMYSQEMSESSVVWHIVAVGLNISRVGIFPAVLQSGHFPTGFQKKTGIKIFQSLHIFAL